MKNYCLIVKHIKNLPNHKEYRKKGFDGKEKNVEHTRFDTFLENDQT